MDARRTFLSGPVLRQLTRDDHLGRGEAVRSAHTEGITPPPVTAHRVARSVGPYCAVGCGQKVFVKDEKVVQIEGDPDSPISRGRLCPKGGASKQLVNSPTRVPKSRSRRPPGTEWEDRALDTAMEMIPDRVLDPRRKGWQENDGGHRVNRTM